MAWFKRDRRTAPIDLEQGVPGETVPGALGPVEAPTGTRGPAEAPTSTGEPDTDTVGNPVVRRSGQEARHAAPEAGPTRAELRMIRFVVDGRVARTVSSASTAFWRIDGAFAIGTKSTMLDWLLQEAYIELGPVKRVTAATTVTERGFAVLEGER